MAEIVGLVASILQLVDTAAKTRAYINDFRDAPKEQQKLLAEIENLKPLLEELQKRVTTSHFLGWVNSMQQFREPLLQLQRLIADLTQKLKSTGRVLGRLSWPLWGKEDAEKDLGAIERFKSLLNTCLAMDIWESAQEQRQDHRDILKSVQDARADHISETARFSMTFLSEHSLDNISSLKEIVQTQRIDHRATERDVLIEWLSPLNFFPRHADIFSARQPGTGAWLLEDDRFKDWKYNSGQTLWCHGMRSRCWQNCACNSPRKISGVACIYLNHKEAETQSPVNLLASLSLSGDRRFSGSNSYLVWRQFVLKKAMPSAVVGLYERHREPRTRPSLDEVNAILTSIAAEYSRACVIIDALDEYPEGSRDVLFKCIRSLGHNVSLLFTSRPHINIEAAFPGSLGVEIRATEHDIRRYIQGQIIQSSRLTEHVASRPELGDEIESTILQNVDGMFLLAKLHIDSLATKNTVKTVREALRNLPKNLNRTYDEALQRIDRQNEDDRNTAQLTLCWVFNAKRLLSVSELIEALAVEPGTVALDPDARLNIKTVLSVCAGLVIIDQAGTVRLIHYTTQRYLDDVQPLRFPDAQTQLTGTCITYLSFDTIANLPPIFKTSRATLKEYPFLDYAISYCLVHACGIPELQIQGSILSFLSHASHWVIYWQRPRELRPNSASALWIVVFFNLQETVKHLLALSDGVPKALDEEKGSAMHIACQQGHLDMVQLLIDNGFSVHTRLKGFGAALHAAAYGGHTAVARLLIENGASINDGDDLASWTMYGSPLQTASLMGNVDMIRFLVVNGADFNSDGGLYGTALGEFSAQGDEEMVYFLIQNGVDLNAPLFIEGKGSALMMAKNEVIARILLKHGADVNAVGGYYGTALHKASCLGMEERVRLLIKHGANIDARGDSDWGTALQVAAFNGKEGTARILLEHGADVHAKGGCYGTAWEAAWNCGHKKLATLLFKFGARPTF
ncbi:ankyrin repeat-containing domain protein [Mycena rebaudengoi]|nr:ankyrin repeat-containing domain protein [Mycena rebaudengoi]